MNFRIHTHYLISRCLFFPKKNPRRARRRLAPGVWRHPITWFGAIQSPSVAQWSSTRLGPKIEPILILLTLFHKFPKTQFAPKSSISMIWSCRSVLPSQNRDAHLFHVEKNTDFMICNGFNNFMVLGPRPMGPSIFEIVRKFILWSGIYLEVFLGC